MTSREGRPQQVVVVGAGLAGLRTVQELRAHGFEGSLVLLGDEPHRPYDRPPLSKELLAGTVDGTELDAAWDELGADLRLGEAVVGLDVAARSVLLSDGSQVPYDDCVLATGAEPVRVAGAEAVTLRTLDDSLRLRATLTGATAGAGRQPRRLVVVGAGWIGAEVATVAAAVGWDVDVVEASGAPLHGSLPAEVAALTVPWYAAAGTELHLGALVTGVARSGDRCEVRLHNGRVLAADVVLEAVGVRPATAWLHEVIPPAASTTGTAGAVADGAGGSPLALDGRGAVLVDPWLRTSQPGVWALGDVAARWAPRYGRRLPGGHWEDALKAPATLAPALLAGADWADEPPGVPPYDAVPYVWSDHLGHSLQLFGLAEGRLLLRGDPSVTDAGWTACWLGEDDRLQGVLVVDNPREVGQARRVVDGVVDPARLADPSVPLREAAVAGAG